MDSEWDRIILGLVLVVGALVGLPRVLPRAVEWSVEQLLAYHVLVPASDAVVQIPSTGSGLDLPRILIGVGVLVVVGSVARRIVTCSAQER